MPLIGLLLLVSPLRAEALSEVKLSEEASIWTTVSSQEFLWSAFLMPYAYAYALPHLGFARYPYEEGYAYGLGRRSMACSARASGQRLQSGGNAALGEARVRGANRLGWDVSWASFDAGVLSPSRRGGIYNGHITANYAQNSLALLEFGFGAQTFQAPGERWGASAEMALQLFPAPPWTVSVRYQAASLRSQAFHDASMGIGIHRRRLGLGLGYRVYLNPLRDLHGPEAALYGWF